ncbi:hypothetical protein [Nocardioides pantholopis]|uniref:hypothetical protein n=1 Tax=Nocardioides pantholopis TaxID=2483798 RepID=UPI000FDCA0FE|nr:hypothetical protein [Nocardioides pantholopis]
MTDLTDPRPAAEPTADQVADLTDRYEQMTRLAALFDSAGGELRRRATLGEEILADPEVADSAELSPRTWQQVEEDLRGATGRHGLLGRSAELDADALVVRATVQTYRWIDELQQIAYDTLGSIAGRAIGYLAPEVALGGTVVSAGLIEIDPDDREDVAAYLDELALSNRELLEHVSGGGGLLDGLQLRALLTVGALASDTAPLAARGGMRALGADSFATGFGPALRDIAGGLVEDVVHSEDDPATVDSAPRGLGGLMTALAATRRAVAVQRVTESRYIAYLPGPEGTGRRLRLVGGDPTTYTAQVLRALAAALGDDPDPRLLLVGSGQGGVSAAEIAAAPGPAFTVDQVVTAGAPAAQAAQVPDGTHVLALEDRGDPVVLLGSLLNANAPNRLTVLFDSGDDGSGPEPEPGDERYVAGGRAADAADHPELRAVLDRLREQGFLAP